MYVVHIFCSSEQKGFFILSTATLTNGVNRLVVALDDDCNSLQGVLDLYREQLNIPADANLAVNGEPVEDDADDFELNDGDEVTAIKSSGSKG